MKNGSQAANERFFDFPEIRLIYLFQTYLSIIIFLAKKILSRGEAIFQRFHRGGSDGSGYSPDKGAREKECLKQD
jgi:hypothetical protein